MCILSYLPANTPIDVDGLLNGGLNNPDGHGFAIADKETEQIIWGHSLDIEDALAQFIEARDLFPEGPALFHSRWATHGSVKVDNCHPFRVGKGEKTVLAHNGILPKDAHPTQGDDRSDTKILAEDLMPKWYSRLDNRRTRQNLARWAGNGNKLVILTVDPKYRRNIYLVNENAGQWDHKTGIWHSNGDYKYAWKNTYTNTKSSSTYNKYVYSYGYGAEYAKAHKPSHRIFDAEGKEICWVCDKGRVNPVTRYCDDAFCDSCNECGDEVRYCMCYEPKKDTTWSTAGKPLTPVSDDTCKMLPVGSGSASAPTEERPYWHNMKAWDWD